MYYAGAGREPEMATFHPQAPPARYREEYIEKGSRGGNGGGGGGAGNKSGRREDKHRDHQQQQQGKHWKKGNGNGKHASLLDEFRNSKGRHWDLNDLTGNIVQFCQDQHGSRFIQQKLEVTAAARE